MILYSIGVSRRLARIVAVLCALALMGGSLLNAASAGSPAAPDRQSVLSGSDCVGSNQDLAPPTRAGCARISGYITAGARFGADERIGGRSDPFAPIAGDQPPGLTIVSAPFSIDRFLPPSPADIAR